MRSINGPLSMAWNCDLSSPEGKEVQYEQRLLLGISKLDYYLIENTLTNYFNNQN